MINTIMTIIPCAINIGVFWVNRHKSSEELKNIFMVFQFVIAVTYIFTFNWLGIIPKLLFIVLIKILSAGFVKGCWILSCALDVINIIKAFG